MWKLLFEFINYLKINKPHSNIKFDDQRDDIAIKSIKKDMLKLGYSNNEFLNLKEDYYDVNNCSSREILIAIGWLISTYDVIELFSQNVLNIYNDEYFKEKLTKVTI
jgi:hypothetical protein